MDPYHQHQARKLYIYLGLDSIFSLNLNALLSSPVKPELVKEFHFPDTDTTDTTKYSEERPLFKGIFVKDSKLHCIGNVEEKVFSFSLPSFSPDHSTHIPFCSNSSSVRFITISNKVYALETGIILVRNRPIRNSFYVFEPDIGKWKNLPKPPAIPPRELSSLLTVFEPRTGDWKNLHPSSYDSLHTVIGFQNKILFQTCYGDFTYKVNSDRPEWKAASNVFPRIFAALEYQGFLFVLTKKPYKLVLYDLALFGKKYCFSRVLDIWKDWRFDFSELDICWASLNLVGNNLICLVLITQDKIHIYLIRFMKTYIYADLEAYHECDIPRELKKGSNIPMYSTFVLNADINCNEREENPPISPYLPSNSRYRTSSYQIEDKSMDHNQLRSLYIYFGGFGALLSLNFNELCKKGLESKSDFRLVFSNFNKGAEFPVGMGLFARDSKLHFFGGENLQVHEKFYTDYRFHDFRDFVGLTGDVQPIYFKYFYGNVPRPVNSSSMKKLELTDECFNQKVFSFNPPYITPCNNTPIPNHSGCKLSPLVFTISDKIYALSTVTVSRISVSSIAVDKEKLKLFEVFEPEKNEWRHIDKLPSELYNEILRNTLKIKSHCVFRDKMLLQTSKGNYVFDSVLEDWDNKRKMCYPDIHSAVEYNDEVLLVFSRRPAELLVYELASFGKKDYTSGKIDIVNEGTYIPDASYIFGASLNLIDQNHISLVLITIEGIRVTVFEVGAPFRYAAVKVHKVFDAPEICYLFMQPLSTFFLLDLDDDTKAAAGLRKENSTVSRKPESNDWELFKRYSGVGYVKPKRNN